MMPCDELERIFQTIQSARYTQRKNPTKFCMPSFGTPSYFTKSPQPTHTHAHPQSAPSFSLFDNIGKTSGIPREKKNNRQEKHLNHPFHRASAALIIIRHGGKKDGNKCHLGFLRNESSEKKRASKKKEIKPRNLCNKMPLQWTIKKRE